MILRLGLIRTENLRLVCNRNVICPENEEFPRGVARDGALGKQVWIVYDLAPSGYLPAVVC